MGDGVGAGFAPAHAAQAQTLVDDAFASRLDRAAADLPTVLQITRVVHPMRVVLQIIQQAVEHADHLLAARLLERTTPRLQQRTRTRSRPVAFGEGRQMFGRMVKIENLLRRREVHVQELFQPRAAGVKRWPAVRSLAYSRLSMASSFIEEQFRPSPIIAAPPPLFHLLFELTTQVYVSRKIHLLVFRRG